MIFASRKSIRELIVEFTMKTGMRINEALSITWEQVDSDEANVTVGQSKLDFHLHDAYIALTSSKRNQPLTKSVQVLNWVKVRSMRLSGNSR
jgi:integrase